VHNVGFIIRTYVCYSTNVDHDIKSRILCLKHLLT